ncbi:lysozyme [Oxalobacter aliiformigenes]|uniref:lysozyme n=1 Tax=Oxalobacter aliiformigenes TaxID=2946593 RepID=UPI0022AED4EA|nr:lysozyme [Oxalobacter aliiformigenes]MCZ4065624.1 lysozyme [Oxalobacter aliiformigenes]WAV98362.1 lysozyme [Oxalobacter aliiformigenes]
MANKTRITVAALAVSAACLVGIATHEGYRSEAYKDAIGIPTIGFGETAGVKMGDRTTPERALVQLSKSSEKHADAIRACIRVPLYQHEFDAYVSLAYNIGPGNFCRSTLVKKLNAKDYAGACEEIRRWNRGGGKVLPGLVKRREAEYRICKGVS